MSAKPTADVSVRVARPSHLPESRSGLLAGDEHLLNRTIDRGFGSHLRPDYRRQAEQDQERQAPRGLSEHRAVACPCECDNCNRNARL